MLERASNSLYDLALGLFLRLLTDPEDYFAVNFFLSQLELFFVDCGLVSQCAVLGQHLNRFSNCTISFIVHCARIF